MDEIRVDHKSIRTKADLINLSKAVQVQIGCNANNNILKELYNIEEKELKTFKMWKDGGYCIKKGSKAYTFWSAPVKGKNKTEKNEEKSEKDVDKEYKFFSICKLFTEDQVEKN